MMMQPLSCGGELFSYFPTVESLLFVLTLVLFSCSKRSSGLSSSGAPIPAAPLLSQGGGDVFTAIVPPLRSSVGFLKKRIAE